MRRKRFCVLRTTKGANQSECAGRGKTKREILNKKNLSPVIIYDCLFYDHPDNFTCYLNNIGSFTKFSDINFIGFSS